MLSYDSTGEAASLTGQGHTNLVSGLIGTPDGRVFTAGYDDRVREVEGSNFTYVSISAILRLRLLLHALMAETKKKLNANEILYSLTVPRMFVCFSDFSTANLSLSLVPSQR